jgi:hypothetical protein
VEVVYDVVSKLLWEIKRFGDFHAQRRTGKRKSEDM